MRNARTAGGILVLVFRVSGGAFLFGFFSGALVLPCNPGMIAAFFAKSLAVTSTGTAVNMLHFVLFAVGIATPLLVFAVLSERRSRRVIQFLVKRKTHINRIAGAVMFGIFLCYLLFVLRIFAYFVKAAGGLACAHSA